MAGFWRKVLQVSGVATEVLGLHAVDSCPRLQVLILPGNPGSAQYYVPQMELLHQSLLGQADIMSITHAGHDSLIHHHEKSDKSLWSLSDQIQHTANFLRQYMLLPGRPPLAIAAHSIGAYIAVHAVHEVERDDGYLMGFHRPPGPPIVKVISMFPFFWLDKSQMRIRLLSFAAAHYEVMGLIAQVLSLLPQWVRLAIIRYFAKGNMDPEAADTTQRLLSRSSVRNYFYMAHTEFRDLDRPPPLELLRSLGRRHCVLGCPEDIWMTSDQYQDLVRQIPGLQTSWMKDVRHAYCTSQSQCMKVTETLVEILAQEPTIMTYLPRKEEVDSKQILSSETHALLKHGSAL
ncbi:hypothetical protein CEUSTIGMA_g7569.t1 [Chlamydomonas eustigma]|uniref:AB hydrolase-1 domain-containing protein n=1 Tax=Chlamydomonas eustigma TaxID=1157962 RepID=A0A250XAL3_9CHLO|nr:hypothetical protein CEUSTIGMA_g7569.t1 [Chlamydomonas eustigma]|eukprot:GAX80131.1 hypothetical protein CEUSTIGMA_g7569.t1 [Chlamydomonas eustigma]